MSRGRGWHRCSTREIEGEKQAVRIGLIAAKRRALGEMGVMALSTEVGLSQSALSQHLARMRYENLVGFRRDAQSIFHHVADHCVGRPLSILKS